jgi:hypothetical protein
VRFSPPDTAVTIRARPDRRDEGGYLLTIEDWGVGMPPGDLIAANELLASPREVDLAVAQRLGFHVVARLAARHGISVSLGNTPGSGVTAVVALPAALFAAAPADHVLPLDAGVTEARPYVTGRVSRREPRFDDHPLENTGWVEPVSTAGAVRGANGSSRARWSGVPAETLVPSRHGLDGAPDGGWRGWWNPESVGPPTRHSDRQPVYGGGADAQPAARTQTQEWPPSPTPRRQQALPAIPPAMSEPAPGTDLPEASPEPEIPSPRRAGGEASANGKPGLRRRVPQAHLAPELRQPVAGEDAAAPQVDGAAASALSRYQASRQAAQAVVDETGAAGGMRQ